MKEIDISGQVSKGNQRGRKIGFRTANIVLDKKLKSGVFGGTVKIGKRKYPAAIFIGRSGKIMEAHLLNFFGNLYGQKINVKIKNKIREVMDFKSDKELKRRIEKDISSMVTKI